LCHRFGVKRVVLVGDRGMLTQARIDAELRDVDGLYVIRTSLPEDVSSTEQTVRSYKQLSLVEQAFRTLKSVDLKVRPIFHRLEERVRAHVFLCMLAYYVEFEMRQRLAPILFVDEDASLTGSPRDSVVAPARPSEPAQRKATTKYTDDGQPVQSFRSLLDDLATITHNQLQIPVAGTPPVTKITKPTPTQANALQLLNVTL
jgi:hypothetical protein